MSTSGKPVVALVGTDSLRGKEIKNLLSDRSFPFKNIEFFDPGVEEEYSKLTQFREEPKVINNLSDEALKEMDLVFLAADKRTNRRFGRLAASQKFHAIDLSEAFVGDNEVPTIVAGINDGLVRKNKPALVANPHPATIILTPILHVINKEFGVVRAIVFVLQPVSAFEEQGIEELANQSFDLLSSAAISKKVFKAQIAFNLLSQIKPVDECGLSEAERQIMKEVREILEDKLFPISLSLIQAPVFHSYSMMMYLELRKDTSISALADKFKQSAQFKFSSPSMSCPVSSVSVAGKDKIFIGQLKEDESVPNGYWLWTAADNLIRGSALNAYEIARHIFA